MGKHFTEEQLKKLAYRSPEVLEKLRKLTTGKHYKMSAEGRAKICRNVASRLGVPQSPERIQASIEGSKPWREYVKQHPGRSQIELGKMWKEQKEKMICVV